MRNSILNHFLGGPSWNTTCEISAEADIGYLRYYIMHPVQRNNDQIRCARFPLAQSYDALEIIALVN
ncbi:hypothetical protein CPSG_08494 [Coccidioides posadasii str. Silveira]|uniref:Uncharacterized protein n=1 Tax=Coccidioides posadasii (strain RMSCC 757 / Silveira) TaxID=443226 RepID=E9DFH9_COCPS|nr:hypothetical protein CPSG_08494 [Coccidioides posadasii str. Silveira]